jgi:predicted glycogen debranching enzyme
MAPLERRITADALAPEGHAAWLMREWLIANGLGGYASGTIGGMTTRRYHGLLIGAFPAPLGRRLLLCHLSERLRLPDGRLVKLSGERYESDDPRLSGPDYLTEFRLEMGLPVWRYEVDEITLERQVVLPHEQNTVFVIYRLLKGGKVRLKVLPTIHNRSHDHPVTEPLPDHRELRASDCGYEMFGTPELPTLRMCVAGARPAFTMERQTLPEVQYPIEESRGYEARGTLWSPGYFRFDLSEDTPASLVASAEPWEVVTALDAATAVAAETERRQRLLALAGRQGSDDMAAELVLAADQFLIRPVGRTADAARVRAEGGEVRSVIAGYHWFTDWGRDTMISLEGLTLVTGRHAEAAEILRMFDYYIRDGLIPNLFPEGETEGLYHTADATLWFFHALDRYMILSGDREILIDLFPKLVDVAESHLRGTRFGIGVDPHDGLLRQGAEGYQLTWMDAKVGDWVVTPRRGKTVEINALWYNALRLLAEWSEELQRDTDLDADAGRWLDEAERVQSAFNRRFWFADGAYLYDVVDGEHGDDAACRPNQVFAISLKHPVAAREFWEPVLNVVRERLLTPVGLRSLAREHQDYQPKYYGDIRARDAAYHQGTVWGWLIGPFVDAWLKLHPDDEPRVREWLSGFERHLDEACVGSISEIFDAEPPFTPRGCIAQAWSVAEVLRCLTNLEQFAPPHGS